MEPPTFRGQAEDKEPAKEAEGLDRYKINQESVVSRKSRGKKSRS